MIIAQGRETLGKVGISGMLGSTGGKLFHSFTSHIYVHVGGW